MPLPPPPAPPLAHYVSHTLLRIRLACSTMRLQYIEACFDATDLDSPQLVDCEGAPYLADSTKRGADGIECNGTLILETEGVDVEVHPLLLRSPGRLAPAWHTLRLGLARLLHYVLQPGTQCHDDFMPLNYPDLPLVTTASSDPGTGGLSGGAIAGIVIGVIAAAGELQHACCRVNCCAAMASCCITCVRCLLWPESAALAGALFLIIRKRRTASSAAAGGTDSYVSKYSGGVVPGSPADTLVYVAHPGESSCSPLDSFTLYSTGGGDAAGQRDLGAPPPLPPSPAAGYAR